MEPRALFIHWKRVTTKYHIYKKETYKPYTLVGPTVTRPVYYSLAVLLLDNQLYILLYKMFVYVNKNVKPKLIQLLIMRILNFVVSKSERIKSRLRPTGMKLPCRRQCDQTEKIFFNIRPFATIEISPIMSQFCQSSLSILPKKKKTIKKLPKICKL